jgi:hypothetical protein
MRSECSGSRLFRPVMSQSLPIPPIDVENLAGTARHVAN